MKLLLLYPPQQTWYGPHLGLPSLTAFLRRAGIEVVQRDLNQWVNRAWLTPAWLERAARRARSRLGQAAPPAVTAALASQDRLAEELPAALACLGNPAALDDEAALRGAFTTLGEAYALLSAGWHPTAIGGGLTLRRNPCRLQELAAAVADPAENPFWELPGDADLERLLDLDGRGTLPDLVGLGFTYEDQLVPGLTLAARLRRRWPDLPLVGGGSLVSRLLPALRRLGELPPPFAPLDWLVVHEGETALLRLCEAIDRKTPPGDALPNLLRRGADGRSLTLGPPQVEDLATLPTPDFGGLDLDGYLLASPVLPLLTSRGCYWRRCGFCAHHTSYGPQGGFRLRPAERLAEDLTTLARRDHGRVVYLVDEAIPLRNLRRVAEINRDEGLGLGWFGDVRMERGLDAALLGELRAGGCKLLIFGQESGCAGSLARMRKGVEPATASRILHDAAAAGIASAAMYFVGFPGETVAEAMETARFIEDHADLIAGWGVGAFSLLDGAPAHADPAAFGLTWVADEPEDGELGNRFAYRARRGLDSASAARIAEALRRRMAEDPRHASPLPRELLALRLSR